MRLKRISVLLGCLLLFTALQAGCGKMKKVAGIGDTHVDITEGRLLSSMVLTKYNTQTGVTVPIPKLEDSFVGIGPAAGGKGALIQLSIPLKSIQHAITDGSMPEQGLPGGRAIYGTVSGKLPAQDLKLDQLNLRFYLSNDVFGLFIPIALPSFGNDPITFNIKDSRGYIVAYGFAIPAVQGANSGLLVLFPVTAL